MHATVRALMSMSAWSVCGVVAAQVDEHGVGWVGCPEGCGRAHHLQAMFNAEAPLSADEPPFGTREGMDETDVLHNSLELSFDVATRTITGANTMTVRCARAGLTEFTFALRSGFAVPEVVFNGATTLAAPVSVGVYLRRVTLPRPLELNEVFTLRVAYTGVAVNENGQSIAFGTSANPSVHTMSWPYYAGSWWPVKDGDVGASGDNSDKATFAIAVTAPAALTVVSNGLLEGIDDLAGGVRRHRWRTNYPMAPYLACFAAAPYVSWSTAYEYPLEGGGTGSMPMYFYLPPGGDTPVRRAACEQSGAMIAAFRTYFGEYPFVNEKYGIYTSPQGGMEHQTISMLNTGNLRDPTTAHELAHQWWGDHVTPKTWHDVWLSEGFATYAESLWRESQTGVPGQGMYGVPQLTTGTVYRYDVSTLSQVWNTNMIYFKGGRVLYILRRYMGDDAFFRVLREYRARFGGGAATTADFARVVSDVAGRDMSPVFDAWIMGEGTPTIAWAYEPVTIGGAAYLRLWVNQTQGAPRPAYFPSPVQLRVASSAGTEFPLVRTGGRTSWHLIPIAGPGVGLSVSFDPNAFLLRAGQTQETYPPGPPKIVAMTPAPGSAVEPGVASIVLRWSDAVTASAADLQVLRDGSPVACSVSMDAAAWTATLTPTAPLAPGAYSVRVRDSVSANGFALDGETASGLPSGDGVPGGDAVLQFTVTPRACHADFNGDGFLDFFDYFEFVGCFEAGDCPTGRSADFNGDGFVDFFDYGDFVSAFEVGC